MGALVSSVNRISSVFEDEVKVRLELVSDERLIYEDQDTSKGKTITKNFLLFLMIRSPNGLPPFV